MVYKYLICSENSIAAFNDYSRETLNIEILYVQFLSWWVYAALH